MRGKIFQRGKGNVQKKLFDYATKELSQDAFLRWLFESWEVHNLTDSVRYLLRAFCNLEESEEIESITTVAQYRKIDIVVKVIIKDGRKIAIFIEDKTFTNQHDNQLENYNSIIQSDWAAKGWDTYKIFYKTSKISSEDFEAAKNSGWEPFDIERICKILKPYAITTNDLLEQYKAHLLKIKTTYENTDMPRVNENKLDYIRWDAYFTNTIIPRISEKFPDVEWRSIIVYQSKVVCLRGYKRGTFIDGAPSAPFIEVRSENLTSDKKTDTLKYKFEARILCYDIPDDIIEKKICGMLQAVNGNEAFATKKGTNKQIGKSRNPVYITNDSEFVEQLSRHTEEYLKLVTHW